jgi:amidase
MRIIAARATIPFEDARAVRMLGCWWLEGSHGSRSLAKGGDQMPDQFAFMDATEQAELVHDGHVTPLELVDAAIKRIENLDQKLNAVVHPMFDEARKRAIGPLPNGPFRGVPIVAKDSLPIAGARRYGGTHFLQRNNYVDPTDDALTTRYLDAGFIFVGKTNMPELGILPTTEPVIYGPTLNPWDTDRSAGGSSGGTAAAVASGMVSVGHAADGGGSIRIPSAQCGVFGLKPTLGRVTSSLPTPDPFGVDHAITRSVRDSAGILDVTASSSIVSAPSRPWVDEVDADPGKLRIGFFTTAPGASAYTYPECVDAVSEMAALLTDLGHDVQPCSPAGISDPQTIAQFLIAWNAGVAGAIVQLPTLVPGAAISPGDIEPLSEAMATAAMQLGPGAAMNALAWLGQAVVQPFLAWWTKAELDLLLSPTIPEPPLKLGEFVQLPSNPMSALYRATRVAPYTALYNLTRQPAVSIPLVWSEGLPIGVMLAAPYAREDLLFQVAGQVERARPWRDRRPPLSD